MGLGCATHIIKTLLKLQHNLTDKEMEVLEASLTPEVYSDGEQVSFCMGL